MLWRITDCVRSWFLIFDEHELAGGARQYLAYCAIVLGLAAYCAHEFLLWSDTKEIAGAVTNVSVSGPALDAKLWLDVTYTVEGKPYQKRFNPDIDGTTAKYLPNSRPPDMAPARQTITLYYPARDPTLATINASYSDRIDAGLPGNDYLWWTALCGAIALLFFGLALVNLWRLGQIKFGPPTA